MKKNRQAGTHRMPRNVSAGRNAAKPIGWRDPNAHLVRNSGALRKGQGVASGFWGGAGKI
jgi:hypothetical protein